MRGVPFIREYTVRLRRASVQSLFVLIGVALPGIATTRYVSPSGNDSNRGTSPDSAFATLAHGVSVTTSGDTLILAGATYAISSRVNLTANGTVQKPIHLLSEDPRSKRAVLDFASQGVGSSNQGIQLTGSYWHIRGLDVMNAGDNGMLISGGSHDTIEWCTFQKNSDAGLQIRNGASHDLVLNCDSWWNYDAGTSGGNADGFAPKLDVGDSVVFRGCRAWGNSDDGWDGYLKTAGTSFPDNMLTIIENCWAFDNGYYHGDPSSANNSTSMNGNGFKMGGSTAADQRHPHILRNCLSFGNKSKQFDQNHNKGSMTLLNCTAYGSGANFAISEVLASGGVLSVKNCISAGNGSVSLLTDAIQATNSWSAGFSASSGDFISTDTAGVRGPRKADGSLPDIAFMHLAPTSGLIDRGTNVGIPFVGGGPDLGAFESPAVTRAKLSRTAEIARDHVRLSIRSGSIRVTGDAPADISIFDQAGRLIFRTRVREQGSVDPRSIPAHGTVVARVTRPAQSTACAKAFVLE